MEAQYALLAGKGTLYEDVLKKAQLEAARRSRTTDLLVQRDEMLRPTSRTTPETIRTASPVCLVISPTDLGRVLAAASARKATVVFLDSGLSIPPDAGAALISQALQAFETAKRSAAGKLSGRMGYEVSSEKRIEDAKRRAETIRPDWGRSDRLTSDLLAQADLSFNTAVKYLGRRSLVQKIEQKKRDDHLAYLVRKATKQEQANDE